MKVCGTYSSGAARLLQIAIAVTSSGNNPRWPYTIFWPDGNVEFSNKEVQIPAHYSYCCQDTVIVVQQDQNIFKVFINDGIAEFQKQSSSSNNSVERQNSYAEAVNLWVLKGTIHDQFEVEYEAECMKHCVGYKPHEHKES